MLRLPCARCGYLRVGRVGKMCLTCTFATQTPAERVAIIDAEKAEKEAKAKRQSTRTVGMHNRTWPYAKVKERYYPPRPYRQSPNPAACTAKVIRNMLRYGTRPR